METKRYQKRIRGKTVVQSGRTLLYRIERERQPRYTGERAEKVRERLPARTPRGGIMETLPS